MPDIRYARSGDVAIGYQVVGEGPVDLVFIFGVSNLVWLWQHPAPVGFLRELASFSRLILFDHRGMGVSDRPNQMPGFDVCMDDIRAVLDAAGSERAVVMGAHATTYLCAYFAAAYPERTEALILFGVPQFRPSPDAAVRIREIREHWGEREFLRAMVYKGADEAYADWFVNLARLSGSPQSRAAWTRWHALSHMDEVVATSVRVPTLVLHGPDSVREAGDFVARLDHAEAVGFPWIGSPWLVDGLVEDVRRFIGRHARAPVPNRVLATLLFTDIVDSTEHAVELGDREWKELLAKHHTVVRRELTRFGGREHDTAGDGFFASFDTPARAIRCARSLTDVAGQLGLEIRQGVHTGECETFEDKLAGIAVVVGARIKDRATAGEILVSSTVRDLSAGSELEFVDRGEHDLKGVPGRVQTYAVVP